MKNYKLIILFRKKKISNNKKDVIVVLCTHGRARKRKLVKERNCK